MNEWREIKTGRPNEWRRIERDGHVMTTAELRRLYERKPAMPLWKLIAWLGGMGIFWGLLLSGKLNEWLYRITR